MNILYTCDNNYVMLMSISMISLFKSNKHVDEINVYFIGENISDKNKTTLQNIANEYKRKCVIIDLPNWKLPKNISLKRWPKSAYSRLLCGTLLPKEIDKIIYIDCDTVIKESLLELYENDNLSKYTICGVKECISGYYKKNIGLSFDTDKYINAGVLLINLKKLRKKDMIKEIESFITEYGSKISYADQDILNYVFNDSIGILEAKYNVMTIEFVYNYKDIIRLRKPNTYYNEDEINRAVKKPYIIHYTTNMTIIRPWFINSNHPRKDDFMNIFNNENYFKNELKIFNTNNFKFKIWNLFLKLPECIGYRILGITHSFIMPVLKNIK